MKYGFIGLGNMASAIIRGMVRSGNFPAGSILGFNRSVGKTEALAAEVGLVPMPDIPTLVRSCDVIVLAVKPQMLPDVLPLVSPTAAQTVITIAAGKPAAYYEAVFGEGIPVVRVMPNISARVLEAASGICGGKYANEAHIAIAKEMFSTVGTVYDVTEPLFAAFSALAGASGAFIHLYIDALASAGVKNGLPRPMAQEIACQAVLGAAKLTMASDLHPIALADQVCSPGGTTIEGIHTLKRLGFESAVQQAVDAVIEKDRKLAQ
ncbi:MAG: pyrroline-5-carboxylate reductase [Oscillospiraceae bacterium]|nr:pyrroline-5-carboxylate reductase [Oscillospiraceae bacterium]